MSRSTLLFLALFLPAAYGQDEGAFLKAHVQDARAAESAPAPAPSDFAKEAKALSREWKKFRGAPRKGPVFLDFTTPEMARLVKEANEGSYAAGLSKKLTLPEVLAGVYVRNPALLAARRNVAAALDEYPQVSYLDNLLLQYSSFLRSLDLRVSKALPMDGIAAHFPPPGTLELKAAVVRHGVELARAKYETTLADLVTEARTAYADFAYLDRAIAIESDTADLLAQLVETARSNLAAGTAHRPEVLLTQTELSKVKNDLLTLQQDRQTARARLNRLLALPPETPLAKPSPNDLGPLPSSPKELYARARKDAPEVRVARAMADRMDAMVALLEKMTYPALSEGLAYPQGLSLKKGAGRFPKKPTGMPDFWFGLREAYLRGARESLSAARAKVHAAEDAAALSVKRTFTDLDTARRLAELYRKELLVNASEAYRDAASSYAAGKADYFTVIDALRTWLRFRLDADRAQRDLERSTAALERAVGGRLTLEEKNR